MAKRQRKRGQTTEPYSVVEAARSFAALAIEVQQLHLQWQTKWKQLSEARLALRAATRVVVQDGQREDDPTRAGKRRVSKGTLDSYIDRVMTDGRPRRAKDVLIAATKGGYQSRATPASQLVMVRIALAQMAQNRVLKRVELGEYVKR